jgi:hypothetical protein
LAVHRFLSISKVMPKRSPTRKHLLGIAALTALTCTPPLARADGLGTAASFWNMFSLSGFGTLGMTHSSLDTADYTSTAFEPNGAGHSRDLDFADDTKFGVQLTARFTNSLSAVVQVVSDHQYDNTFSPHVEWANFKYAITPDLSVRVGRIELPTFLDSDYREVGYATPWVRVPIEVYSTDPITNSDGADLSYRLRFGEVADTLRILYGYSDFHVNPGMWKATGTGIVGIFDTVEYRDLTVRGGLLHGDVKLALLPTKQPVNIYSAAIAYDAGVWFVQGELARVTVDEITPGYLSGYVTAGYRLAKFTPYVTYAQSHSLSHATVFRNPNLGQRDVSAGVRWDFLTNMDLKVQFDHVSLSTGSIGDFTNIQPTFELGGGANVLSATLDFVF